MGKGWRGTAPLKPQMSGTQAVDDTDAAARPQSSSDIDAAKVAAAPRRQLVDDIDAAKIAASPTYNPKTLFYVTDPFRFGIPIILGLCFTFNGGIFIVALAVAIILPVYQLYGYANESAPVWYADSSPTMVRVATFLFYGLIPAVLTLNTGLELYLRYRNTLSPRRVVITASLSIVLWSVFLGLSFTCALGGFFDTAFCPFNWTVAGGQFPVDGSGPLWTVTWLTPLGLALYIPYLVLGAIGLHRCRNFTRYSWGVESGNGRNYAFELQPQTVAAYYGPETPRSSAHGTETNRSAITSTCYTSRLSNGPSFQETLPTDASSSVSEPPSYNEKERINEMTVGCAHCGHTSGL